MIGNQDLKDAILKILPTNKEDAISIIKISNEVGYFKANTRVKKILYELAAHGKINVVPLNDKYNNIFFYKYKEEEYPWSVDNNRDDKTDEEGTKPEVSFTRIKRKVESLDLYGYDVVIDDDSIFVVTPQGEDICLNLEETFLVINPGEKNVAHFGIQKPSDISYAIEQYIKAEKISEYSVINFKNGKVYLNSKIIDSVIMFITIDTME